MNRSDLWKIVAEMPEGDERDRGLLANAVKLLAVMIVTITLTELLYMAGINRDSLLMLYFLGVLAVSVITPRYGFGILAAVISTIVYTFHLLDFDSGYRFSIQFPITLLTMLAVTIIASSLTIMLKMHTDLTRKRASRTDLLYRMSDALADAMDAREAGRITVEYLSQAFSCPLALFLSDPRTATDQDGQTIMSGDFEALLTPEVASEVHRMFISSVSGPLLADEARSMYYRQIIWSTTIHGVAAADFSCIGIDPWKTELMDLMCRQAGHAMELIHIRDAQSDHKVHIEREKTRGALLGSISEDFKSPLTSILDASNAILVQKDMLVAMRDSLLIDIQENAMWLMRMMENIVMLTQVSNDSIQLNKRLESAEDVMNEAVSIVRERHPEALVHVRVPTETIMIPMDANLISQVIVNLLLNAINHSERGSFVLLSLRQKDRLALFEVSDQGAGIPAHIMDHIFEIHTDPEDESRPTSERGIAIGLSICRTIVQSHGGIIEAQNRREGGARFSFWLPMGDIVPGANR